MLLIWERGRLACNLDKNLINCHFRKDNTNGRAVPSLIFTLVNGGLRENSLPSILNRLNLNADTLLDELKQFKTKGHTTVETVQQLKGFCKSVSKKWRNGIQLNHALE